MALCLAIAANFRRAGRRFSGNQPHTGAWCEVFLGGKWYTFDARHNHPRIGRIVIARGRDAADVAISTTFGTARLARFTVVTEEAAEATADLTEGDGRRAGETAARADGPQQLFPQGAPLEPA
jgi:hypothetical protein